MPSLATFALFAYRHEAFVAEAIRSVAKQTYRPLELVITDDASPDDYFYMSFDEVDRAGQGIDATPPGISTATRSSSTIGSSRGHRSMRSR